MFGDAACCCPEDCPDDCPVFVVEPANTCDVLGVSPPPIYESEPFTACHVAPFASVHVMGADELFITALRAAFTAEMAAFEAARFGFAIVPVSLMLIMP
jgi:hypothetical protein